MDNRYIRQEPVIGGDVQRLLSESRITILGLGALGSRVLEQLVRLGCNNIVIIDRDIVEESNLHRCSLYLESDIGLPKAHAAYNRTLKINSSINLQYHISDIYDTPILLLDSDIVMECLDSISARIFVNDTLKNRVPWIHGSAVSSYGEAKLFMDNDCYKCIHNNKHSALSCSVNGINPMIAGIVSMMQCNLLLKHLKDKSNNNNPLYRTNIENMTINSINIGISCKCNNIIASGKPERYCGGNTYRIPIDKSHYNKILSINYINDSINTKKYYKHNNIIVTDDSHIITTAENEKEAVLIVNDYVNSLLC
ncbi:MAG: HesA/MoeB/ThiF family protein [Candidatus Woesearchaeota archaeon]